MVAFGLLLGAVSFSPAQQKIKYLSRLICLYAACACVRRQSAEASFPWTVLGFVRAWHHRNTPTIAHVTSLLHSPFLPVHVKLKPNPNFRVCFLSSGCRDSSFRCVGPSSAVFTNSYHVEVIAPLNTSLKSFLTPCQPLPSGETPCSPTDTCLHGMHRATEQEGTCAC